METETPGPGAYFPRYNLSSSRSGSGFSFGSAKRRSNYGGGNSSSSLNSSMNSGGRWRYRDTAAASAAVEWEDSPSPAHYFPRYPQFSSPAFSIAKKHPSPTSFSPYTTVSPGPGSYFPSTAFCSSATRTRLRRPATATQYASSANSDSHLFTSCTENSHCM